MLSETRYHVETPEQVEIEFDLAGPGSRFCAWLIDVILQGLMMFALFVVVLTLGGTVEGLFRGELEGQAVRWTLAVLVIAVFVISTGYYVICEMWMRGRSPGKQSMSLRVIRDDGTAITFSNSLIRNLIRLVDFLPAFYAVGGLISLYHGAHKRLGDLAAGTIVVKESALHRDEEHAPIGLAQHVAGSTPRVNMQLSDAQRRVLSAFLARRAELEPQARMALSDRIARRMWDQYAGYWGDAESYIERLLEGRHYENGNESPQAASQTVNQSLGMKLEMPVEENPPRVT